MSISWANKVSEYITLHQVKDLICNPFRQIVALRFPIILSAYLRIQKTIFKISYQLVMKLTFNREVFSRHLADFLITNSMEISNLSELMDQIMDLDQTILFQTFNLHKPSLLSPWPHQYLQISTFKHSLSVILASFIHSPRVRPTCKLHIPWSSLPISLHLHLSIIVRVISINHLRRPIQTKTEITITTTMVETRCKVTIRGHMLREVYLEDSTIIMDSSSISNSSRYNCRLWTWAKACKSRFRLSIRTPTITRLSSQMWWTLRISSIKIRAR